MKNTRVVIRAKGRGLCIERGLSDCLQRELFTDVSICCGGKKIRANKGVLAAASPVFCHLLKEWPHGEDTCVVMAGYTEEEVNGLIRYIYTGHLNTAPAQGTVLEKIIQDFRIGFLHEAEVVEYIVEQHDEPMPEVAPNFAQNRISQQNSTAMKGVGPKIVAVTSPRPLLVKVQSVNQVAASLSDSEMTMPSDVPCDVAIENSDEEPAQPLTATKRKRSTKSLTKLKKHPEPEAAVDGELEIQKSPARVSSPKKSKPASPKFGKKKYCCPFCKRRFLTRGNVKNHMRIHTKGKPFQCPVCSDYFADQEAYEVHLVEHQEKDDITEEQLAPLVEESHRMAEWLLMKGELAIPVDETDPEETIKSKDDEIEGPETDQPEPGTSNALTDEEMVNQTHEEEGELEEVEEAEDDEQDLGEDIKQEPGEQSHGANEELEEQSEGEDDDKPKEKGKSKEKAKKRGKKPGPKPKNNPGKLEGQDKGKSVVSKPAKSRRKGAGGGSNSNKNRMTYQILQCDFCPMKYHKWSAFYIHRCSHTGETPVLPCNVCQESFPNIKMLKEHRTREHPDSVFKCEHCDRRFLSRSALLMHLPVHSVSLNFQCRYCQAKMRTLKERYVHERVHLTDVTPYQCSQCDKKFGTLVNLRSHLRMHSAEGGEEVSDK